MTNPATRDHLLDATAALVARYGYRGTGVNAVLADSGVRNGSLYHHFPAGKDELVAASVERSAAAVGDVLAHAAPRGPAAVVKALFDTYARALAADDFAAGCPVGAALADTGGEVEVVREAAALAFRSWSDALVDALAADGWPRRGARSTADAIVCLLEGAVLLAQAQRSTRVVNAARDAASALLAPPIS